jgi:hypothetical protein
MQIDVPSGEINMPVTRARGRGETAVLIDKPTLLLLSCECVWWIKDSKKPPLPNWHERNATGITPSNEG